MNTKLIDGVERYYPNMAWLVKALEAIIKDHVKRHGADSADCLMSYQSFENQPVDDEFGDNFYNLVYAETFRYQAEADALDFFNRVEKGLHDELFDHLEGQMINEMAGGE